MIACDAHGALHRSDTLAKESVPLAPIRFAVRWRTGLIAPSLKDTERLGKQRGLGAQSGDRHAMRRERERVDASLLIHRTIIDGAGSHRQLGQVRDPVRQAGHLV